MQTDKLSLADTLAALNTCANEPEVLNSERIAKRFGNFGIDLVSFEDGVRTSNLYSLEGGVRICRTCAVVRFQEQGAQQVAEAHADILAGESIGARFRAGGWQIRKQTIGIACTTVDAENDPVGRLMCLRGDIDLAVHEYRFVLERDLHAIEYAHIVETHHPDYLSYAELLDLYGGDIP